MPQADPDNGSMLGSEDERQGRERPEIISLPRVSVARRALSSSSLFRQNVCAIRCRRRRRRRSRVRGERRKAEQSREHERREERARERFRPVYCCNSRDSRLIVPLFLFFFALFPESLCPSSRRRRHPAPMQLSCCLRLLATARRETHTSHAVLLPLALSCSSCARSVSGI